MLTNWNIRFWEYEFFSPHWLWLMCMVPLVLFFIYRLEHSRKGEVKYSGRTIDQRAIGSKWIGRVREVNLLVYGVIACLLIFAMARPFHWAHYEKTDKDYKNGIDIVITMDVSGSMLAMDFTPNRLEAAKQVAKEFIDGRSADRIGLVAYAGAAYTACPPTLDYSILKQQIDAVSGDYLEGGTAIGEGLGLAVTRLRSDSLQSKVVILLTDGMDNGDPEKMAPMEAAALAKAKNVRVYTIGVGSYGTAQQPVVTTFGTHYQTMPVEINEPELRKIAAMTGGKYFRATDEENLRKIYKEIEKLEKRRIENSHFKSEPPANPSAFLNWALVLALLTWSTSYILFKQNE